MTETIDAEVIEEPGTELEAPTQPSTLFRTDNPAEVLTRAQATADALMPVVRSKNLISNIQGREHLRVEAWTTLGAMLGVTPVCTWTRKLEDGWEARVEARTLDGRVIGAAEAECLRGESTWAKRDDYALRSMAQTRATSKALASVLRFVATLAGVEGTPAEEMPTTDAERRSWPVSDKQLDFIDSLLKDASVPQDERLIIRGWAEENLTGGKQGTASAAIEGLKNAPEDTVGRLMTAAHRWNSKQTDAPPPDDSDLPPIEDVA